MPLVDCHQQEGFLMFHQACVLLMFSSFFDTPVSPELYKNQKLILTNQLKMYNLAMYTNMYDNIFNSMLHVYLTYTTYFYITKINPCYKKSFTKI